MEELTGFQRDLLFAIAGKEAPHGLALKAEIEDYYETEIHHGRLYPNLETLVEEGYVAKGEKDKRTNQYELTNMGRNALAARRAWTDERFDS